MKDGIVPHSQFLQETVLRINTDEKYIEKVLNKQEKYTALRSKAKELAYMIEELAPSSREKSLAMTKLKESIMWANASIAMN